MVACAPSYFIMAIWEYRRRLAQLRAVNDDVLRAAVFGTNVNRPRGQAPGFNGGAGDDEYDLAELGGGFSTGQSQRRF